MEEVLQVRESFIEKKEKVLSGKHVGLPLDKSFPKLARFIPVIPPATQIMLTSNSGIGKTHSWIGMVLLTLYKLIRTNPDRKFKFRFVIALLEDSKEMLITRLYASILLLEFGIRTDVLELQSMRGKPLPPHIEEKLPEVERYINILLEYCEINDSVTNPTGIYKWARAISRNLGEHKTKEMQFSNSKGELYMQEVYSHYEPHDPDEQVIMIVDNLNNLTPEVDKDSKRLLSERETINRWTRQYGRLQITKHWHWSLWNILQQSSDSERPQYDNRGNLVIEKTKPSLDGLGNSKESQRDHILIFGLWAPVRYGISEYAGYDIKRLDDAYRSFIILKSNISESNREIPMYFDGAASIFKELPKSEHMTEEVYQIIEQRKVDVWRV